MLHQYLTDELAAHEVVGNRLCLKKKNSSQEATGTLKHFSP
jgi:hypothetical protein